MLRRIRTTSTAPRSISTPARSARGYGAISDEVHRVLLALPNGDEIEATIYEPPPELGLNYRFFVGFAPTKEVVVTVESKTGNRLGRSVGAPRTSGALLLIELSPGRL
jgi:hypothetical protein